MVVERGSAAVGVDSAVSESVSASEAVEHLRIVGGGGGRDVARSEGEWGGEDGDGADREADLEHAGVCAGRAKECGAGGSARRDLCRGSGTGAGLLGTTGVDGRAVCGKPDRAGEVGSVVQDGDLGRWRRDGEIEYLGRIDSEVKVRGMRIDLREIETVLAGEEGIEEAVVELKGEGERKRVLVAYLVARGEGSGECAENCGAICGRSCRSTWCRPDTCRWRRCRCWRAGR